VASGLTSPEKRVQDHASTIPTRSASARERWSLVLENASSSSLTFRDTLTSSYETKSKRFVLQYDIIIIVVINAAIRHLKKNRRHRKTAMTSR